MDWCLMAATTRTHVDLSSKVFCGIHLSNVIRTHELIPKHMFVDYIFKATTTYPRG